MYFLWLNWFNQLGEFLEKPKNFKEGVSFSGLLVDWGPLQFLEQVYVCFWWLNWLNQLGEFLEKPKIFKEGVPFQWLIG